MRRRTRQALATVLIAGGLAQFAFIANVLVRSARLERETRLASANVPAGAAFGRATATRRQARPGHSIGHLEIRRLGLRAAMVEGIDASSLLEGVGHVPRTAFPGEPDNAALAGHRDMHFAPLQHIEPGDSIWIVTADGEFLYGVDSAFVVTPDRGDLMGPTGRPTLTLITCYPFNWIGPAPRRFIVRAHEMDAPRSERPS